MLVNASIDITVHVHVLLSQNLFCDKACLIYFWKRAGFE